MRCQPRKKSNGGSCSGTKFGKANSLTDSSIPANRLDRKHARYLLRNSVSRNIGEGAYENTVWEDLLVNPSHILHIGQIYDWRK